MFRFAGLILLALMSINAQGSCGISGLLRPLDVLADEAEALLQKREYAALDRLVVEYRNKNAVASDGQPKLMGLYAGVSKSNTLCRGIGDSEAQWQAHRDLLSGWVKASPALVAPRLAMAKFESAYGWKARGGGYASSVSAEGWKLFRERAAKAKSLLEKLKTEASNDPEWYAAMLSVALDQGWENNEFDALYTRAVSRFPNYFQYYFIKGAFYSARWRGSKREFKTFVEEAVKATEPTLGQTMYARLHWSASQEDMFKDGQTDWSRMKLGFEKMLADFPDAWNRNNFAKFACKADDLKTLREQLALIGDKVVVDAWQGIDYFNSCKQYASIAALHSQSPSHSSPFGIAAKGELRVPAPNQRDLILSVPDNWVARLIGPGERLQQTIEIMPEVPGEFAIVLTTIWPAIGEVPAPGLGEILKHVEGAATAAQANSDEKSLPLVELRAPGIHAFYFSATDRASEPNGFKYLTQGALRFDELRLAFTIRTKVSDGRVKEQALKMLQAMRR